jgi:hypothetical protein
MALVSILLAVVAFVGTLIGFLTTPIPVLGAVVSFAAAGTALGGIMLGGRAISASKLRGMPNDAARIAVVLNVLAFIPALLVALTCGVCNAVVSSGKVQLHPDLNFNIGPGFAPDGGPRALPPPARPGPAQEPPPEAAPPTNPDRRPSDAPPANLPPPPLPPGPRK